jgi:hypothetical protein
MAAVAWALQLGSDTTGLAAALADPQGLVDRAGPDALVLAFVPALAWLCWAWGALGLLLTAASTVPGGAGRLAGLLLTRVVPGSARRAAALALGVGLSTAAPVVLLPPAVPFAVSAPFAVTAAAADTAGTADAAGGSGPTVAVDWPSVAAPELVPDWPGTTPERRPAQTDQRVVLRGDCLWDIAAAWLQGRHPGGPVTDDQVRRATQDWWQANAAVIGPDPDLLLPGQVLRPPG